MKLKPSTYKSYFNLYTKQIQARIAELRLLNCATHDVQRVLWTIDQEEELSHQFLLNINSVLSAVFTHAFRQPVSPRQGCVEFIISLEVDHCPDHHSHCFHLFLENRELRELLRGHAFAALVSGIEVVPKRLDDTIRCNPDVGCTVLHHGQNESEDTTYSADLLAYHICGSGHGAKMPSIKCTFMRLRSAPHAILYDPLRDSGLFSCCESEIIRQFAISSLPKFQTRSRWRASNPSTSSAASPDTAPSLWTVAGPLLALNSLD